MKILVTGSTGFIGTYFKNTTSINKDDIIFGTTSSKHDRYCKFEKLYRKAEYTVECELFAIIHCAAVIPSSFVDATYENCFLPNIEMMENICKLAKKKKVKKFIYLSSFGSMQNPQKFDTGDYYTLSKITGELFCNLLSTKGVQSTSLRVSAPFGEWQKKQTVIRKFSERAIKNEPITLFGSGSREQNFTYVGNVVTAIESILKRDEVSGVYNIVGSRSISMIELAKKIITLANSRSEIEFSEKKDPQENYRAKYDYERAAEELDYTPVSLDFGLKKYISWLKNYITWYE
jgi:UDP-glucose 4-epimerase